MVLDPDSDDATETVHDLTGGLEEPTSPSRLWGDSAVMRPSSQAVDMTRVMGRIVVLGVFHDPVMTDWMEPLLKE